MPCSIWWSQLSHAYYDRSTVVPIAAVVGYSRAVNVESPMSHPQRFVASGCDKDRLESVRSDWKIRNQGIGLRDVR